MLADASLITQTVRLLTAAICVSKFIKGKKEGCQVLLPYLETGYLKTNKQAKPLELDILFLGLSKKNVSGSLLAQCSNSFSFKGSCFVLFPKQLPSFVRLYSTFNLIGVLIEIMLCIVLQEQLL